MGYIPAKFCDSSSRISWFAHRRFLPPTAHPPGGNHSAIYPLMRPKSVLKCIIASRRTCLFELGHLDAADRHGDDKVDAGAHLLRPLERVVTRHQEVNGQVENHVDYGAGSCTGVAWQPCMHIASRNETAEFMKANSRGLAKMHLLWYRHVCRPHRMQSLDRTTGKYNSVLIYLIF